jgi:hypothetical protein
MPATCHPFAPRRSQTHLPIPLAAPVTSATPEVFPLTAWIVCPGEVARAG